MIHLLNGYDYFILSLKNLKPTCVGFVYSEDYRLIGHGFKLSSTSLININSLRYSLTSDFCLLRVETIS